MGQNKPKTLLCLSKRSVNNCPGNITDIVKWNGLVSKRQQITLTFATCFFKPSNRNPHYLNLVLLLGISIYLCYSSALFGIRSFTFILQDSPIAHHLLLLHSLSSSSSYSSAPLSYSVADFHCSAGGEAQLKRGEGETRLTVETFTHNAQGAQFVFKMLKPKKNLTDTSNLHWDVIFIFGTQRSN